MASFQVHDALQREFVFTKPPQRIVSLVPSDTYSIAQLAGVDRLAGRTEYCEEPHGLIEQIPTMGGTKSIDVAAVIQSQPDLVIANQEENTQQALESISKANIPVFVVFPKRVEEGISWIATLACILGVEQDAHAQDFVQQGYAAIRECTEGSHLIQPARVFCPIWNNPLMTINQDTYIHDMIGLVGGTNVFASRQRNYPLAADLGQVKPKVTSEVRDTRYPRVTEEELVAHQPDIVLVPDEPYAFNQEEMSYFRSLPIPASRPFGRWSDRIVHIQGKDICWYGTWAIEGIRRLRRTIHSLLVI